MQHLMWFRNDLRIEDNPALSAASDNASAIFAVFCWCPNQWKKHGLGPRKIDFLKRHLEYLSKELEKLHIPLKIIAVDFNNTANKLQQFCKEYKIQKVFWNREYELNERHRDQSVIKKLSKANIICQQFDDQVLIPPEKILNQQGKVYSVFTPFKKALFQIIHRSHFKLLKAPKKQTKLTIKNDPIPTFEFSEHSIVTLWPAGAKIAQERLHTYCQQAIHAYDKNRDFPHLNATSLLSAYLAVGAISQKQCFLAALEANQGEFDSGQHGTQCWINELAWREFYRYILFHHPNLCKSENYQSKYNNIQWRNSRQDLKKWQQGQTGFPIIDAAMRQLNQTGWMHNRLRMIVAMFLTKNLLIDWREGEAYFLQQLIDADYASNNGGWQWSASTGTDAVPYFRVFNPVRQSEKFDPEGMFIKKYCPELESLTPKEIHHPSAFCSEKRLQALGFPRAMCDLNATRKRAIEAFKRV